MSEPILRAEHLGITFGGLKAVSDFNMTIDKGELVGLIGPNGAGKTTVFNLLTGVYQPTEGEFFLDGKRMNGKKTYQVVRAGIARTFQNIRLFKQMTVLENVMTGMHSRIHHASIESFLPWRSQQIEREIVEKSMEALKIVGLDDKYKEFGTSLSYGQQRRLEIARALVSEPKLLLLDEPAAGMNIKESADLLELIRWINEELHKTIIFIEHNMRVVMNVSDYIYVLDHGTKISEGTPDVVSKDPVVIEAYLGTKKNGGETDAAR